MSANVVSTEEFSVAISTMNRPDTIARCIASIWRGTMRPRELVIVDQSHDDATEHVVRGQQEAGLPIRYQRADARGLGASQNVAVALCTTEFVAVTDDDCIVDARWLEVVAGAFASTLALDLCAGAVLALPSEGDRTWPVSLRTSPTRLDVYGYTPPWNVGSGNNFTVRRATYLRIGGCDERLGPGSPGKGGVDTDLFYRMLRAGARLRYEPGAVVYHERQRYAERLARRPLYGHGMGASVALRLRDRDPMAARLLVDWATLRAGMLWQAARRRDWRAVNEEIVMLGSTVRGIWHGLRAPPMVPSATPDARGRSGRSSVARRTSE